MLLEEEAEQRRVTAETARRCIIQAHVDHLAKALKTGTLSEHAVKRLAEVKRSDGFYVIPVSFAPAAKDSRFRFGPATLYAKQVFDAEYQAAIDKLKTDEDSFDAKAVREWESYSVSYVRGHENAMAWKAAREVAEYVLACQTLASRAAPARAIWMTAGAKASIMI